MVSGFSGIRPSGGATGAPKNLARRLQLIEKHVDGLAGKRVADLGCGSGDYVRAFLERTPHVVGIEYRAEPVERARTAGLPVEQGDIELLRFAESSFDVVVFNEVLEHVPNDLAALCESRRVIDPDGYLVVFSPNRWYPFETHGVDTRSGRPVSLFIPGIPWIPVGLGRRLLRYRARNYWPRDLRRLVEAAGYVIETSGFLAQTFENISGHASRLSRLAATLRAISLATERASLTRRFAVSQWIIARPTSATSIGR